MLLNLKNAVELVNPPNPLLLSIFSCFSWPPIWCPENADVVQLQGARCAGMAHAISSFVQRSRWAAAAFFRLKVARRRRAPVDLKSKAADVAHMQGARCDGMAHAISSVWQRSRWAASAVLLSRCWAGWRARLRCGGGHRSPWSCHRV